MHNKYNFILQPLFLFSDLAALIAIYYFSTNIYIQQTRAQRFPWWLIPLVWIGVTLILQLYNDRRNKGRLWNLARVNSGYVIFAGMILLVLVFGKYNSSRISLLILLSSSWILLNLSATLRWSLLRAIRSKGYNPRFLAFIGETAEIQELKNWIGRNPEYGYQNAKIIELQEGESPNMIIKQIHQTAGSTALDELAIGKFHHSFPEVDRIIDIAEEYGLRVRLVQDVPRSVLSVSRTDIFGPFSVINIRQEPLNNLGPRIAKRAFDTLFSIFILVCIYWWFYLLVGVFIKMSSKGPVVFKQLRVGRDGKHFVCYKFRTMRPNGSDSAESGQITKEDDSRVTWIGKILRKTNLDELPQFYNVLRGEMSIIGPRPHMVDEDAQVSTLLTKYKLRRFVKPGITGWAAVNGYRGGTENMELMQERVNHDIYYIENWTPWLDIKIFFLTIWQMLTFSTKAY